MSGPQNVGYTGPQNPTSDSSQFNAQAFVIQQMIGRIATTTLVQVKAVTNDGVLSPVGFVDVLPLVNQIDGDGNATPHGIVHNLPYFRLQGGTNAVIIDPQVGDIGIAAFADRDISSVKANKAQANPGSRRRFDMADGLYIGGVLNGTPVQYVQFSADGISITSPMTITLNGKDIVVHASRSYSEDVNGYGSRITYEGGSAFTEDTYMTGAVVTTVEHGWTPPDIPPP